MSKSSSRLFRCSWLPAVCLAAGSLLAGCGVATGPPGDMDPAVHRALAAAQGARLYALHPYLHETSGPAWADAERLHDSVVLGSAEVAADDAAAVLAAVFDGIRASDGTVAACFNPRHGIHIADAEGDVDLVICFECLSLSVYRGGEFVQSLTTTRAPEARLARYWRAAGLSLHE